MIKKEDYNKPHMCPVCGKFEFPTHGSFDVCEICGWEDDMAQENEENDEGGANWEGLKGYRALYKAGMIDSPDEEKMVWLKKHKIYG